MKVTMAKKYIGVGGRLKWLRKHGSLARFNTVREMCKHLNLKNSTWYDWVSDKYYPRGPIIAWLENDGVDIRWLETGRGNPYVTNLTPPSNIDGCIEAVVSGPTEYHKNLPANNLSYCGIHYVFWPDNEPSPQMTGDFWNIQDEELLAITVEGDSMDGAYSDAMCAGDTILIRISCTPQNNEIWVIRCRIQNGEWSNREIRRISLLNGGIVLLRPYHTDFKTVERLLTDVQFLAKVEYRIQMS